MQPAPITLWPWPRSTRERPLGRVFTTRSAYAGGVTGSSSPDSSSAGTSLASGWWKSSGRLPFGHASHCATRPDTSELPSSEPSISGSSCSPSASSLQHTDRSEEHTSELQSLMRNSYDVFCLKKKKKTKHYN